MKNTFRSFLVGSFVRISSLHNFTPNQTHVEMVSRMIPSVPSVPSVPKKVTQVKKSSKGHYEVMTVKSLKQLLSYYKVKGRSKLTRKSQMVQALYSL